MPTGIHHAFRHRTAPGAGVVILFSILSFIFVSMGIMWSVLGSFTHSIIGYMGIIVIVCGLAFFALAVYKKNRLSSYWDQAPATAGGVNQQVVTLQRGVTAPSQGGGTTTYVIESSGMQTAGGQHGYVEMPVDPPPVESLQYPPSPINPVNPVGLSPANYVPLHHPSSPGNRFGVIEPAVTEEYFLPPPSYNAVFGNK